MPKRRRLRTRPYPLREGRRKHGEQEQPYGRVGGLGNMHLNAFPELADRELKIQRSAILNTNDAVVCHAVHIM